MASTTECGREGEEYAVQFLREQGFDILHRNWRHPPYEIDLMATKGGVLHIVEVKYRVSNGYGHPEMNVGRKKFRRLVMATEAFLSRHPEYRQVQFDILSIQGRTGEKPQCFFIGDVFL